MHQHEKPSVRAVLTNLHVPMPWWKKVWLIVRNGSRRILTMSDCCGHPGEPGC
jgi:hypothetical protein